MADDTINVAKLLKAHLIASTGVVATLTGATGRWIKPAKAIESPPGKYITYNVIGSVRPETLANAGSGFRQARVQIDCWCKKGSGGYGGSIGIAEAVIEAMCSATAFSAVLQLEDDDYDKETKTHRQILDYSLSVTSTAT